MTVKERVSDGSCGNGGRDEAEVRTAQAAESGTAEVSPLARTAAAFRGYSVVSFNPNHSFSRNGYRFRFVGAGAGKNRPGVRIFAVNRLDRGGPHGILAGH